MSLRGFPTRQPHEARWKISTYPESSAEGPRGASAQKDVHVLPEPLPKSD